MEEIIAQYYGMLLNWAKRKTGTTAAGEELSQEVMLQLCVALQKTQTIAEMERFVWKIAHYTFCNWLRRKNKLSRQQHLDENIPQDNDFAEDLAEQDIQGAALRQMRRSIANLRRMQREILILHYLDGLTAAAIAGRLGLTETAVAWHLFDARKKLKEELTPMKQERTAIYRPGKLAIGLSGLPGNDPDTKRIQENLIRQNLCLLCYQKERTAQDLAELTGIPLSYLEFDLDWLVDREFLEAQGKKHRTAFPIISPQHHKNIGTLFTQSHPNVLEAVLSGLKEAEAGIRKLDFYGASRPWNQLLWPLIMLFTSFVSRNCPVFTERKQRDNREIRPDGGRYYIMASDVSEPQEISTDGYVKPEGWGSYYGICSDSCLPNSQGENYYWLGVYTFADKALHPTLVAASDVQRAALLELYKKLLSPDFAAQSLAQAEKQLLAEETAAGIVAPDLRPRFTAMSQEQLYRLQQTIFAPIMARLEPEFKLLAAKIETMHKAHLPKVHQGYLNYLTYVDLWNFGIYTYIHAAESGKLALPAVPEDGTGLTLVIVM